MSTWNWLKAFTTSSKALRGLPALYVGFLVFAVAAAAIAGTSFKITSRPLPGPIDASSPAVTQSEQASTSRLSQASNVTQSSPPKDSWPGPAPGAPDATTTTSTVTPSGISHSPPATVAPYPSGMGSSPLVVQPSRDVVEVATKESSPTTSVAPAKPATTTTSGMPASSSSGDATSPSPDSSSTSTTAVPPTSSRDN